MNNYLILSTDSIIPWIALPNKCSFFFFTIHLPPEEFGEILQYIMINLILLAMITLASVGMNAQTVKGEGSLMGNVGYQTNYESFGLGVQGRYAIANNLRIARDVT